MSHPDKQGMSEITNDPAKAFDPLARNAATAATFTASHCIGVLDLPELTAVLEQLAPMIHAGNTKYQERMLFAQANTLDAIFNRLASRAATEAYNEQERMLRLALKAQSNCRVTLETLAAIKNPPLIFAKQANIAHGPQQVNNDALPRARGKSSKPLKGNLAQPKLLEQQTNELARLDARTARKAGRGNQAVATVATVNGATKRRGQSKG
jgi:hypothetical protein